MQRGFLLAALFAAAPSFGHDVITTKLTWTNEISRLMNRHCASCHNPGGSAMSLLTYADSRPWAKAIRDEVLNRRMPPWDAVKGFGDFRNDASLTQPEMDLVVSWVEGGAPEGDPAYLEAAPASGNAPAPAASDGAWMRLTHSAVLSRPMTLRGIYPEGALEVTACLPDQTVERLIWIPQFHGRWNHAYLFRNPLPLPRGSRIMLYSQSHAAARMLTGPPQGP